MSWNRCILLDRRGLANDFARVKTQSDDEVLDLTQPESYLTEEAEDLSREISIIRRRIYWLKRALVSKESSQGFFRKFALEYLQEKDLPDVLDPIEYLQTVERRACRKIKKLALFHEVDALKHLFLRKRTNKIFVIFPLVHYRRSSDFQIFCMDRNVKIIRT